MGPELRHVRYLLAVAEHGTFTRAAEALHISQPTLSQQIKQLERAVGALLLDRGGRGVRLTDAGEAYVYYARRALTELAAADRAVLDVADLSRGHLRLAMTPTFTAYLVGPLAQELHTRHPGVTLQVHEMPQDRIETSLLADEIDLGVAFAAAHLPGVTATALFTETLSLVTTAAGPGPGERQPMPVADLAQQSLALLSPDFATRRHIDRYFAEHHISPPVTVEANTIQALSDIVRRTPDLATVLPEAITHDHPHLTPVRLDPPLPTRTVTLLHRESAYRSAVARAFVRLARDVVRERGYAPA
ncbi:transcriptional regulator CynR [Streptomyces sp. NBC_00654]|uniref:transcriptional regulator CynR n=1 Tax=Streptomyces sp. NBC_00654 TaxID=2975799 RepID=UPI00225C2885|nr:transcriptional regulator CynR [Streptomyces sp. NBC_00654]MCX4966764.1 transcriptional regulator CynR [Streptomyces sp. NBC_00654]